MRILVKESSGEKHDIRIPTGLALNRVTAGFLSKVCQKNGADISKEQLRALIKVLKDYKKRHPDWKLLEVDDADGEQVEIIL